jgi:hypothetical protein
VTFLPVFFAAALALLTLLNVLRPTFGIVAPFPSLQFPSVQFPSVQAEVPGTSGNFREFPGTSRHGTEFPGKIGTLDSSSFPCPGGFSDTPSAL